MRLSRSFGRLALGGAMLALAATAPSWGPRLLRQLPAFDVERVEVSGVRLLAPHEVLAASGIARGASVWDDARPWEAALAAHPVIASAKVERRGLHTLRIRVEERRPVALVEGEVLRPVTAAGELLPVDPARAGVDLPLVRRRGAAQGDAALADSTARAVVAEIGRLAQLDPALVARVSEAAPGDAGTLRFTLTQPAAELLVPAGADLARLQQLRATLEDVERRGAEWPARLDLRFADQIVVRYTSLD
jgi:cell division protein FtsQ